jgi:hypothetical protein
VFATHDIEDIAIEAAKYFADQEAKASHSAMERNSYRSRRERSPPRDRSPRGRTREDDYEDDRWYKEVVREERDRRERERGGATRRSPPRSGSGRGRLRERLGPPPVIYFDELNARQENGSGRRGWTGEGEREGGERKEKSPYGAGAGPSSVWSASSGKNSTGSEFAPEENATTSRDPRGNFRGNGRSIRGSSEPTKRRGNAWSILKGSTMDSLQRERSNDGTMPILGNISTPAKAKYKKKNAVAVSREKFRKTKKGKSSIILAVVLGDELAPAWSDKLACKVRWEINSALGKLAEKKQKETVNPPGIKGVYESNDRTHIRIEVEDKRSQVWVNKVLQDQCNLSSTPVANLQMITWYSTRVEYLDLLEQSPQLTRAIFALTNEVDIDDVTVGEGLRYGRRLEENEVVIFFGLKQPAKEVIRAKGFVANLGGHGEVRLYPCEEGEEGPDDFSSGSEDEEEELPADEEEKNDDLDLANVSSLDGIISGGEEPKGAAANRKDIQEKRVTRKKTTKKSQTGGAGKI